MPGVNQEKASDKEFDLRTVSTEELQNGIKFFQAIQELPLPEGCEGSTVPAQISDMVKLFEEELDRRSQTE